MISREDFVGTWKLLSFHNEDENGSIVLPFGKDCRGLIYYDIGGHMGVNIMQSGRPEFKSGDMFIASEDEMKGALRYIAYSGSFEVVGDRVIHRIEISLFPNWVGKEQERFYAFDRNQLTLSTRPMNFNGKKVVSKLMWEKL